MRPYESVFFLEGEGNSAFRPGEPAVRLRVAACADGSPADLAPAGAGEAPAYAARDARGNVRTFPGLRSFVRFSTGAGVPAAVFDNHNHALYFWYEARARGFLPPGAALVHADEHSDLGAAPGKIAASASSEEAFRFANRLCRVGDFVRPCLENGFFSSFSWVGTEESCLAALRWIAGAREEGFPDPGTPYAFDFDADFFSENMSYMDRAARLRAVRALASRAVFVTAATSPYFMAQDAAVAVVREVLG